MRDKMPYDLLIECRSCGIENMIADYAPSMRIFCSQCRERLMDADLVETHCGYVCQVCDMRLVLMQTTEVELGQSACSCGSTDLKVDEMTLPDEAAKAGGLIDPGKDGDEILEDTDWLRSANSADVDDDDYNDMFNQDPGQN